MKFCNMAVVVPVDQLTGSKAALSAQVWGQVSNLLMPALGKLYRQFHPANDAWGHKLTSPFGVVLGCQEDADRFSIAKTLLSKGFGSYQVTTPAFSGEFLKPLQVLHGTDTAVEVEAQGLTGITVPKGNAGLQTVLVLPEYVEAPVSKGQQLGTAAFYQGDIYLYEVPLTAASSVPRLTFSRAFLRLLDNMLK